MVPVPLRRIETALVIVAAFFVAGALWPWSAPLRVSCAVGSGLVAVVLLVVRLRAHAGRPDPREAALQARIDRIRAERSARLGRRR